MDVDCGLCVRQGAREREKKSGSACVCARASECMYMSACSSLFHSYVGSDTTETKVTGRSLPYAKETYKSQHKYRGRSVPCTFVSRVQTSTRIFHSKVAWNF